MSDTNWKKHLLSSGTPLEFETAKSLAEAGFYVGADYEYLRQEGSVDREFSVDVSATYFRELRSHIPYRLDLLAECKYRARDKTILFYQDPNIDDYSGGIAGYTVPSIDQFSPFHLDSRSIYEFESQFPFAYKTIEVFDKGAYEKDLRHAAQQLRFAAPDFLLQSVIDLLGEHDDDRCPRFLTRLLISNAPLRVLPKDITIAQIENAESIESISVEHPVVILASSVGPELRGHYKKTMLSFKPEEYRQHLESMEYSLRRNGKHVEHSGNSPLEFVRIVKEMEWVAQRFMSQLFVVNSSYLPTFLEKLKSACAQSYRARKKSDKFRRPRVKKQ